MAKPGTRNFCCILLVEADGKYRPQHAFIDHAEGFEEVESMRGKQGCYQAVYLQQVGAAHGQNGRQPHHSTAVARGIGAERKSRRQAAPAAPVRPRQEAAIGDAAIHVQQRSAQVHLRGQPASQPALSQRTGRGASQRQRPLVNETQARKRRDGLAQGAACVGNLGATAVKGG
jgi:hypothetical protein